MIIVLRERRIDTNEEPVMLILSEQEKACISTMGKLTKFCSFPDDMSEQEAKEFINSY